MNMCNTVTACDLKTFDVWWDVRGQQRQVNLGSQRHLPQLAESRQQQHRVRLAQDGAQAAQEPATNRGRRSVAEVNAEHPNVPEGFLRSVP